MLQNFLKTALRNLLKRKVYSLINITGLAAGLACFLLISLFINHELSFERWNPKADRIVRPVSEIKFGGNELSYSLTAAPVGPDLKKMMPEVENYCRFDQHGNSLVRKEGDAQQNTEERNLMSVDSTFFELFPVDILAGSAKTGLTRPNTLAISKDKALQYFGSVESALGQTLIFDNQQRYEVSLVFNEIPRNTHFEADFLISTVGNQEIENAPPMWLTNINYHSYILLKDGVSYDEFATKFKALSQAEIEKTTRQLLNMSLEEFEKTGQYARLEIQKMTEIHLHSDLGFELGPNGSIQYIWVFGAIALFVLFVACINFVNLTTARSSYRAKEIGVRKVLGSLRSRIIAQFLSETMLMTAIAVLLALIITIVSLPWFRELTARTISIPWSNPVFWIALISSIGVVGLLAGTYPAFFMSAFDTIKVLKGEGTAKSSSGRLRSALVVFQFATSIILVISTALVYNQLNYILNKKLGFQKDQVIIVDNAFVLEDQIEVYKQQMLQFPEIKSATVSSFLPVPSSRNNTVLGTSREFRDDNSINLGVWSVDHDYLETIGLEMAEGRFFDRAYSTDSSAIVINEKALEILGFDDPIGKKLYYLEEFEGGAPRPEDFIELNIIGVVKNFHWESLRENIGPLSLRVGPSSGSISFKFQATDSRSVLKALEDTWNQLVPSQLFTYRFMDDSFANMYESEQRIGRIATSFALLAIIISFLGLFGLASYTVDQRTKEIGIRKVLGANPFNIVSLLSKDYLKLVGIGLLIAIPVAWWGMDKWLQDFAYRISINWWIFLIAGLVALLIVVLSVSFQSIKASLANPVDALRS